MDCNFFIQSLLESSRILKNLKLYCLEYKFIAKSSSRMFASNPCENSVEQNWNAFKYAVTTGISQFIPQKSSNPKNKLPWINPEIKREMRKKDRLYKKATYSKNQQHLKAFKYQRNLVAKLIKKSHNRYLNKVIGDSLTDNPKEFGPMLNIANLETLEFLLSRK